MPRTFFPASYRKLALWLENYKTKIVDFADLLHLSSEELATNQAYCIAIKTAIQEAEAAKSAYKAAVSRRDLLVQSQGSLLRATIARYKTDPNYTEAVGNGLGIITPQKQKEYQNFKPKIRVRTVGGKLQIRFTKYISQGINLYSFQKETAQWQLVTRATRSPVEFTPELKNHPTPETLQFMAFGVIDDKEIGKASDIVEVLYAG